jgi:type I restriction enzyme S subunit
MSYLEDLLEGVTVERKTLKEVFDISAGGDKPKNAISKIKTDEFCIPILSNGIDKRALYGWTNKAKIDNPSLTISARGTIGWTSIRETPFYPIIRLIVLTPKIELNIKFAYYFMKSIEKNHKVPPAGIPQLTKPMIKDVLIPIPCPNNLEQSLKIQKEIVRILDSFTELTAELTTELTTELTARKKQYSYYREQLLTFDESEVEHLAMGDENVGEFIRGGGLQKKDFTNSGVGCIHYGQIYTHYGIYTNKTKSFVSEEFAKKARMAKYGDLVIATTSENDEDLCKAVAWLGNEEIAVSSDACYYRHNLNPKYVAYFFQTEQFHKQKRSFITGAKVRRVNASNLEKIKISVPSPDEQERIVKILDKFNVLTTALSEALPKEIELRKKQYEYYREKLLTFPKENIEA